MKEPYTEIFFSRIYTVSEASECFVLPGVPNTELNTRTSTIHLVKIFCPQVFLLPAKFSAALPQGQTLQLFRQYSYCFQSAKIKFIFKDLCINSESFPQEGPTHLNSEGLGWHRHLAILVGLPLLLLLL